MIKINPKTLVDLEFNIVCEHIAEACHTHLGKQKAMQIIPLASKEATYISLYQTHEYFESRLHETTIPNHGFDPIDKELQLLAIEESVLEKGSAKRLAALSETANMQLSFFNKHQQTYPYLFKVTEAVTYTTYIADVVNNVIDKYGEIKDNASPKLQQLRRAITSTQGRINSSFSGALGHCASAGYLDDIRESVVDNVRVLAVAAMHRRKVKGQIMGSSKTGSIVYIQPEATTQAQRELSELTYEELEEIKRILKALTEQLRPKRDLFIDYQEMLSTIDVIAAKSAYAERLDACLPKLVDEKELQIKEAYHPLLLLSNKSQGKKTYPQDISLRPDQRIIVISGPNAGGKSITLKTIGLLQLMLQSGMLLPVHEYTRMCVFDKILTDIGDNQSIENHLSTYSYRLKNMNYFLRKCDQNTLFLIDEFGTGTDPELGGALAETFLEVFHERKSYGIITTHYANLKMMAQQTPEIQNANMLFDARTLEPKFKLHMGEAGSSFTFEVAQKNGIPYSLINRSKKKVERGKIRFDKSIANLQKERSKLAKTTSTLKAKEDKAAKQEDLLKEVNQKIQQKLEAYQQLYDDNQRLVYLGTKLDKLTEKYFNDRKKGDLMSELFKVVQIENSKRKKQTARQRAQEKTAAKKIEQEAQKHVEKIRVRKKEEKKKQEKIALKKTKSAIKLGDCVRLEDGKATGTVDKIEKDIATVNYGMFTTKVSINQLEHVSSKK